MTATVKISDWLRELETTSLPQSNSGPGNKCQPCALTLALVMSDTWAQGLPTTAAMNVLGVRWEEMGSIHCIDDDNELYNALCKVYQWNDGGMSFKNIAALFRKEYPELAAQ